MASLELVLLLSPPLAPTLLSEAINNIRARVCTLAGLFPLLTNCLSVIRSSLVSLISGAILIPNFTRINFVGAPLSVAKNLVPRAYSLGLRKVK